VIMGLTRLCNSPGTGLTLVSNVALSRKQTSHALYDKPQWLTLTIKCIYYTSPFYTLNSELLNSQKQQYVMM
jgi:Cdc6-like AAA superfamily ATPase